jgi:hypothetical protein
LLDLSGKQPVVIEIFQYHSHEYHPRYTTKRIPAPVQCDTKFKQTLEPGSNVHSLVSGKPHEIGFLTDYTLHLLDILQKCYTISPQAATTIQTIRSLTLKHASPVPTVNPIGPTITAPDTYHALYRFTEDYKYNIKHKLSTALVLESQSDPQYKIRFAGQAIEYCIPAQLIDFPSFKILTAKKLINIIKNSNIIP